MNQQITIEGNASQPAAYTACGLAFAWAYSSSLSHLWNTPMVDRGQSEQRWGPPPACFCWYDIKSALLTWFKLHRREILFYVITVLYYRQLERLCWPSKAVAVALRCVFCDVISLGMCKVYITILASYQKKLILQLCRKTTWQSDKDQSQFKDFHGRGLERCWYHWMNADTISSYRYRTKAFVRNGRMMEKNYWPGFSSSS